MITSRSKCRPRNNSSTLFSSLTFGPQLSKCHCNRQGGAICTRALVRRCRCFLRLEASGPLPLFAQNLLALCVYESFGLLRFLLGLCVKPQVRIDPAQLVMGRRELR